MKAMEAKGSKAQKVFFGAGPVQHEKTSAHASFANAEVLLHFSILLRNGK